jgi:hypothetical protein
VQQHDIAHRQRELEDEAGEHALELDPIDDLIGGRRRHGQLRDRLLAPAAARGAASAHPCLVAQHAGQPRPQRATVARGLFGGDQHGVVHQVFRGGLVLDQRACESTQPPGVGDQLIERDRNDGCPHTPECRAAARCWKIIGGPS